MLRGPLDRLNAILSLLQPLDRYRAPSAIGSAIGRPLSRPISHPRTGKSPQPPHSKPLRGAQPRDSGAIVSQTTLKQAWNHFKTSVKQKRDRGSDSQPRPRPRLNSQPQGATKIKCQDKFDHDKGQKSAISGRRLHWTLSTGFLLFSSIYVQFSKTSPVKSGESSEKSSGENRVKFCHVCGCHGFFGPESVIVLFSENSRRLELSISKNTPHGRWGQGPGSVNPRFPAGLPFPVPQILEFVALLGDSLKVFPAMFPGLSFAALC